MNPMPVAGTTVPQSEPRRHHLLPTFYMRSFADDRGKLAAMPRLGVPGPSDAYTAFPENILAERDYYAITDERGERSQVLEKTLARLEGEASNAMRALLENGLVLDARGRAVWSEFIAVQVTRGRHFRDVYSDFSGKLAKKILAVMAANAPDAYFERINVERTERGEEPLPELTPELRAFMLAGDRFDAVPSQEHMIEMSLTAIPELTNIFFQMSWKLLRPDRACLLTSDQPVVYWREPNPVDRFVGIGPITAREVRVPLSPDAALVLVHPREVDEVEDAEHEIGETVARCLNRDLLSWPASRQWLHRPGVSHPLPATEGQWAAEWPRPWCAIGRYPTF
jgi:Protein of unknown function (DUF4238)